MTQSPSSPGAPARRTFRAPRRPARPPMGTLRAGAAKTAPATDGAPENRAEHLSAVFLRRSGNVRRSVFRKAGRTETGGKPALGQRTDKPRRSDNGTERMTKGVGPRTPTTSGIPFRSARAPGSRRGRRQCVRLARYLPKLRRKVRARPPRQLFSGSVVHQTMELPSDA